LKEGETMRDELYMLRCRHKLTKGEMAEKTGVSRITYTLIENGERDGKKPFWEAVQREFGVSDADMWKLQKC
jgi:DNA-binding XRE family transcriptional regulator